MASMNPYIGLRSDARQALEFWQSVFGGELTIGTFGEMTGTEDPIERDKVMHGQLTTAAGHLLMASDTPESMPFSATSNISIAMSGDDAAELHGWFDGLAVGGTVIEPLTPAPWGDEFGMVRDRFGVTWLVNVSASVA